MKTPLDIIIDQLKEDTHKHKHQVMKDLLVLCLENVPTETLAIADAYKQGREDGFAAGNPFNGDIPKYENATDYYRKVYKKDLHERTHKRWIVRTNRIY
jgi:hypothetical protein